MVAHVRKSGLNLKNKEIKSWKGFQKIIFAKGKKESWIRKLTMNEGNKKLMKFEIMKFVYKIKKKWFK